MAANPQGRKGRDRHIGNDGHIDIDFVSDGNVGLPRSPLLCNNGLQFDQTRFTQSSTRPTRESIALPLPQ
jgi:hypothetical protein